MKTKLLAWEVLGIIFIVLFGGIMHFFYEWFGNLLIVGTFAPVNESVWEHLKLGYWPLIIFMLIEYYFLKDEVNNFLFGKALASLIIPLFIIVFFYTYTAIIGNHILVLDILSFVFGTTLAQLVSYKILISNRKSKYYSYLGAIIIVLLGFFLILFTFFPPNLPLFIDYSVL
ncbi:MAG: hypothetical protein GF317_24690 [Candidatus Lokiarchaeota archaeon]|nr:hypothetical protein [Candidatus Lokiarchaeota archaeon]MBD3202559.1 hypothetical protein [Candidatus Lokiarchaeota archaeon]